MIEKTILSNLIYNDDFTRKALPFLEQEYFTDIVVRKIYNLINDFHLKYNQCPTKEALLVELDDSSGLSDDQVDSAKQRKGVMEISGFSFREWMSATFDNMFIINRSHIITVSEIEGPIVDFYNESVFLSFVFYL